MKYNHNKIKDINIHITLIRPTIHEINENDNGMLGYKEIKSFLATYILELD